MIDLTQFNLIYYRKTDQRKFLVRMLNKIDVIAIDSVTGDVFRFSEAKLRNHYKADKKLNKLNKKKPPFMNYGKRRIA